MTATELAAIRSRLVRDTRTIAVLGGASPMEEASARDRAALLAEVERLRKVEAAGERLAKACEAATGFHDHSQPERSETNVSDWIRVRDALSAWRAAHEPADEPSG